MNPPEPRSPGRGAKMYADVSQNHVPPLGCAWPVSPRWRSASSPAPSDPEKTGANPVPGPGLPPAARLLRTHGESAVWPTARRARAGAETGRSSFPRQRSPVGTEAATQPLQPPVTQLWERAPCRNADRAPPADVSTYLRHSSLDNRWGPARTAALLRAPPPARKGTALRRLRRPRARPPVREPRLPPGTRSGGRAGNSSRPRGKLKGRRIEYPWARRGSGNA